MSTRRIVPLLLAALSLAGCHTPMRAPARAAAEAQAGPVCRVGPDGAPPVATMRVRETERGIGGTGGPALAERGIGGTGIGGTGIGGTGIRGVGIGGTGIVGVVTGFASLCVDGLEVALPASAQVDIDGAAASVAALRAGQLALVGGTGDADALTARAVSVRHEVTGPVGRVLEEGRRLLVAGQTVSVSDTTWRSGPVAVGDWIAVSGLPTPTGDIAATRIDRATPGRVSVHGLLVADGGRLRIGALTVRPPAGGAGATGYVRASGSYADGTLRADAITSDALATDPAAAFGGQVRRLILQAYVGAASGAASGAAGDRLRIGPAFEAAAQSGLTAAPVADLGIIELERSGPGDSFVATSLRDAPLPAALPLGGAPDGATYGGMPAPRGGGGPFVPAPVPASVPGIGIGAGPVNGPGGRPGPIPTTQPGFGGSLIPGLPPGTGAMMPPGFAGGFPGGPAGTVPGGVLGRPPH